MLRKDELAAGGEARAGEGQFALPRLQQARTAVEKGEAGLRVSKHIGDERPYRPPVPRCACGCAGLGDRVAVAKKLLVDLHDIGRGFRPRDLAKTRHFFSWR